MGRLGLAFRCFFRVLRGQPVPEEALPAPPEVGLLPPAPEPTIAEQAQAIQLLALLQKEGRLLDFLQEEIDGYDEAQVGAAVRSIHRDCRQVLHDYLTIEPVMAGAEGSTVAVEEGFDPSRIRLIGNVTGEPPFSGVLRHHGWRAGRITIPRPPSAHDPAIIAPAEVELP